MTIGELMLERGWSSADVAALLAENDITISYGPNKGGPIEAKEVTRRKNKSVPRNWRTTLGLEDESPSLGDGDGPGDDDSGRRRERPPRRPAEAAITIMEPGAAKRIAGAYRFVGAALAAGAQPNIGVLPAQGVAQVWDDSADKIAELWLEAARTNPWAARFVNMMQAGGPVGDLAAAHLYLAGATAYVVGAGIPGGDAIFAKYSRYRPVVVVGERPDPAANGAAAATEPEQAHEPAAGPVGDDPR